MSWFKRRLNWVVAIDFIIYYVISLIFLFSRSKPSSDLSFILFVPNWVPMSMFIIYMPTYQFGDMYPNGSNVFILAAILFPVLIWVLRDKSRGLGWLAMILFPFGWITFLLLKNRTGKAEAVSSTPHEH